MELVKEYYTNLLTHYGRQYWWPCRSSSKWEIITGAILTQNTSWLNVEKALDNLFASSAMTPEKILSLEKEKLEKLISPAGFFRQKSTYLQIMAEFILSNDQLFQSCTDTAFLREKLLALKGVGRETADSILLYAYDKPIFIIDAYTRRIASRHLEIDEKMPYDDMQRFFMENLPENTDLYKEYHALIVEHCKASCLKKGCGDLCRELFRK